MTLEQDRAADPATSAWVAASAGTGKTYVLTNRVLRLMLAGTDPAKILCVTFTKAAAAEMANRINKLLSAMAVLPQDRLIAAVRDLTGNPPDRDMQTRARTLFAEVLELPGGLKIDTIHAFCQSLMARFPLEAGIAPHSTVADDRTAASLFQEATIDTLTEAQSGRDPLLEEAVATVAHATSEPGFSELLNALALRRQKVQDVLNSYPDFAAFEAALLDALGLEGGKAEAEILEAACLEDAIDGAGLEQAAEALSTGAKTDQERGTAISLWIASQEARVDGFNAYAGQFLTGRGNATLSGIRARLATKKVVEGSPSALDALTGEAERLLAVMTARRLARVSGFTKALLRFARHLFVKYEFLKRRQGVLDYDDLIGHARRLLGGPGDAAWVLYKLDGGIDHILVDEAQDTNPVQWQIIDALASEFLAGLGASEADRTVFAVGDAKQSIYGFQHADPREFARMRQEFRRKCEAASLKFHDGSLDLSFRSTEAVLSLVDAVFAEPDARRGLGDEDRTLRHDAHRAGAGGSVELWEPEVPLPELEVDLWEPPVIQRPADDPEFRLAARIVGQIEHWLDSGEPLVSSGLPIRPRDIMILVRRRNNFFSAMVKALKQRGIAVAGMDRMVLGDQLAVMDMMALARFTLAADDDLTLATVLKSPLVGLDEDQLYALAHGREGTLWQACLTTQDGIGLNEAREFLSECIALADTVPPFEFFSHILERRDGRKKLVARLGRDCLDPLEELVSLALDFERSNAPSLQGFLHWMATSETEVKREMEQSRDEVRVMTVHGAKGLEAPIVFLPDTCTAPSQIPQLLWLEENTDAPLMVWPGRSENMVGPCATARDAEAVKRDEEYNRQLYVAMTRAEDRLYICGYESRNGRSSNCWFDRIAAGLENMDGVETVTAFDGEPARRYASGSRVDELDELDEETAVAVTLPDWVSFPPAPEPLPTRPLMPSRLGEAEIPVSLPTVNKDALKRGNLIHRLLEVLPDVAPDAREEAARALLKSPAHGLTGGEISALADEVLAVLAEPNFAPLFAAGSLAEVPIIGTLGTVTVSGQVDRLVVTDDSVMIVDYKSNRVTPRTAQEAPAAYLNQMAAYRAILAKIYPGKSVKSALLWTSTARLMPLDGSILDAQAGSFTSA